MIMAILAFLSCGINLVGLLTFMSSIGALIDLYRKMTMRWKAAAIIGTIVITMILIYTNVYLILFLAAEYAAILIWYKKQKKPCMNAAIRGIVSIIFLLLAELALSMLFYYKGIVRMTQPEVQVINYLGLAAMQCCLVIVNEFTDGMVRIYDPHVLYCVFCCTVPNN